MLNSLPTESKKFKWSTSVRYFAVGMNKRIEVWKTPGIQLEFSPFVLHRVFTVHQDNVVSLDWSADGQSILSGSKDLTIRITRVFDKEFSSLTLSAHRAAVVNAFFGKDGQTVIIIILFSLISF